MFWKSTTGLTDPDGTLAKAMQFKSIKIEFESDGTAEGTKLTVNGNKIAEPKSLILSANQYEEDEVSLFAEYTVASKGETNGGFSSTRTYTLRKADTGEPTIELLKGMKEDTDNIQTYMEDLPPGLRQSLTNILGAVNPDGPEIIKEKAMPENKDGEAPKAAQAATVDVNAIAIAVAAALKEPLTKDVADAVLTQIRADQTAAAEQATKLAEEKATADAAEQAKIDSGEVLEFTDEADLEAKLSAEATALALEENTAA